MKHRADVLVKCPYYKFEEKQMIFCEGVQEGSAIHLAFDTPSNLKEYKNHFCKGCYYDDSGVPVYGLEIGQRTEKDGEEIFNKFARFTAEKLSFYDQNDNEVAYISDRKLYITHIEVIGSYSQGGFVDTTLADGSIVTRWVGGDS